MPLQSDRRPTFTPSPCIIAGGPEATIMNCMNLRIRMNRNIFLFTPTACKERGRRNWRPSLPTFQFVPAVPPESWCLRGLTFSGVDGLCATNVDLDLLGLGLCTLGQLELQHPSVVISGDAFTIDRRGQGERPDKAAIAALDTAEVLFFLFLFELALA